MTKKKNMIEGIFIKLIAALCGAFILLFMQISAAFSQVSESTDIFLMDMTVKDNTFTFDNAVNITNRDGFDSEPFFTHDGKRILYTSIRDDGQADTYAYRFENGTRSCVNYTPGTSEFYPMELDPAYVQRGYYRVIRVEQDGMRHVVAMKYDDPDYVGTDRRMEIVNVGNFVFVGEDVFAYYVLGESNPVKPTTLQVKDYRWSEVKTIAENVGRSLQGGKSNNHENFSVSYVQKKSKDNWIIMNYRVVFNILPKRWTENYTEVTATLPGREDFYWVGDSVLMGDGSKLYKLTLNVDTQWHEIADFSAYGIKDSTIIAANRENDKLAVVSIR